jgi:hypothetical protein
MGLAAAGKARWARRRLKDVWYALRRNLTGGASDEATLLLFCCTTAALQSLIKHRPAWAFTSRGYVRYSIFEHMPYTLYSLKHGLSIPDVLIV